jgi:hypothetical protein
MWMIIFEAAGFEFVETETEVHEDGTETLHIYI